MKPKLTLMITDDDRRMLNMCLARLSEAMLHEATDKSLVKAFNDLRFSIEMAEDIEDARAVALLYTTVQHALPGVVNPEYWDAGECAGSDRSGTELQ